jgi:[ribosomal protein S5]-alanine N-acetyltransferase
MRKTVKLVPLGRVAMQALLDGDLAKASEVAGVELGDYYAADEICELWRMRIAQVDADPTCENWLASAVVDGTTAIGDAGFHGPPDANGMVEFGYRVAPPYLRQGYGTAIVAALLGRVAGESSVNTVRASISPDNAASLATIAPYGFTQVGEQIDEVDGLELVFERPAR